MVGVSHSCYHATDVNEGGDALASDPECYLVPIGDTLEWERLHRSSGAVRDLGLSEGFVSYSYSSFRSDAFL